MKYHYSKPDSFTTLYGQTYTCNHPVYSKCTLYLIGEKGLAVIQQRYNKSDKSTIWTEIDPWLVDELYLNAGFKAIFDKFSGPADDYIYPTITVRQLMWRLRIKPIARKPWETVFDKCPI